MRSTAAIKTFNTLLVLLGLALLIVSYPKLFLTQNGAREASSPSIGKILKIKNDARLKKSFLFNWNDSASGDEIHNNDLIFTNENSEASFRLTEGQEVGIKSQTLLKLKNKSLEVKNGEVELSLNDPSKELVIIVGDQEFKIRSNKKSKVTVSSGEGESRFKVEQGEVSIQGQNASVTAKAGEEVLAQAAQTSKAYSDMELIRPVDATVALAEEETFEFEAKNAPSGALALAKNLVTENTYTRPLEQQISLPPGEYEWTVTIDGESVSHPAQFQVVRKLSPAKLLSPGNLEEVVFYDDRTAVDFKWEGGAGIVQVEDEFQNLHHSELADGPPAPVEFYSDGTYAWRVQRKQVNAQSPWSESRKLIVRKLDYEEGEPVVIELKRPNQLAEFTWEGAPQAGARFKLSKTKDFKNIVREKELNGETSAMVNVPEVGMYYWRIENSNQEAAKFRPKKVLVRPTPPPKKPKAPPALKLKLKPKTSSTSFWKALINNLLPIASANAAEGFEEVTVAFEPVEDAKLYEIEIYSDQDLKNLVDTIQTKEPSFKWTPPRVGSYTWRIRIQDHWDRWSPFSDASSLAAAVDSRFIKKPKRKRRKKVVSRPRPKRKKRIKKAKKKKIPAPVIAKETRPKKKTYQNSVAGFYAPAALTYENTKTQTVEIDGTALGGHALEYKRNTEWPMFVNYQSSYGKVFEEESFSQRGLEIGIAKRWGWFAAGTSALMKNVSDYEVEEASPSESSGISALGLGITLNAQIKLGASSPLILEASAHGLGINQAALSLSYGFPLKERFLLETKLRGEFYTIENDDSEIESQSFQAFIGPQYLF